MWARSKWVHFPLDDIDKIGINSTERTIAAGAYLAALLPLVTSLQGETPAHFLRSVHASRHANIVDVDPADRSVQCSAAFEVGAVSGWEEDAMKGWRAMRDTGAHWDDIAAQMPGTIQAAREVAAVLDRKEGRQRFEAPVAHELMADYVEDIAAWAVGPRTAGDFLCYLSMHIAEMALGYSRAHPNM